MSIILEKVSKFKKQQPSEAQKLRQQESINTKYPQKQQRFSPSFVYELISTEQISQANQSEQSYYQKSYSNRQFQDSVLTLFIYKKVSLVRSTMMSLALISIFLSICEKSIRSINTYILIVHSIISFGLFCMVIIKYFLQEELQKRQLQRKKFQNPYFKFIKNVSIQLLVLSAHPNLLTRNTSVLVQQPIYDDLIPLQLNNLFQTIMQLRIYLLWMAIIKSSIYCNTRAERLCRIYSANLSIMFGIKSLFQYKPLTFLIVLFSSLIVCFGQMISLRERGAQPQFQDLSNSFWFIIITMGTVGYGEYSPKTYIGRIITFHAALSGIILSSLLILTLGRYLSMSNGENKSHVTLRRLQLRRILEVYSKQTIAFTTKMLYNKNPGNTQQMEQLKKKTEKVKFAIRRIKNLVDTENLKQEINRLFEALSESLSQIYKFQEQYSDLLVELYQQEKQTIHDIQFNFTTEIENIIKDR